MNVWLGRKKDMKKASIFERLRRHWKNELPACVDCIHCYKYGDKLLKCSIPVDHTRDLVTGIWNKHLVLCKINRYSREGVCGEIGIYFKPRDAT